MFADSYGLGIGTNWHQNGALYCRDIYSFFWIVDYLTRSLQACSYIRPMTVVLTDLNYWSAGLLAALVVSGIRGFDIGRYELLRWINISAIS